MSLIKTLNRFYFIFILTFSIAYANNSISIEMLKSKKSSQDGSITLTLSNTSSEEIKVLTWGTPLEKTLHSNLFIIKQGKKQIPYIGKLLKRSKPKDNDYTTFHPNEKRVVNIKLPTYYAMKNKGTYSISFNGLFQVKKGRENKNFFKRSQGSSQLLLINYRTIENKLEKQTKLTAQFTGCSSSEKNILKSAQDEAISIAKNSWDVMKNAPSNTTSERYATWFGSPNSGRQFNVTTHFKNIYNALENETIKFDCSACKTESDINYDGTYAYVLGDEPYIVNLCGSFWQADLKGRDSQSGTLVHELSHFTILAGTNDHVYGEEKAKNLANTNPEKAVNNAENHEYFAENTPYLLMDTGDGNTNPFEDARTISSFPFSDSISTPYVTNAYKFVPKKSAEYLIQSTGTSDPYATLYDSEYNKIIENDDINTDAKKYNFYFYSHLIKNKTYYLVVGAYEAELADYTLTSSYVSRQKNDFNGDTLSDILWRKGSKLAIWYMKSNGKHTYKYIGTKSTSYTIEGIYDFNYDGIMDILWRKGSKLSIWYMKSDGKHTYKYIGSKNTSYKIVGLGDFNDDGNIDILWRTGKKLSLWYMKADGTHVYKYIGSKSTSYKVAKVADMNKDNFADILWRKGSHTSVWYMNSDSTHRYQYIGSKSNLYTVAGLADFNADGIADILWKKGGGNYLWYMKSNGKHTYKSIGSKNGYKVNNIVDMNGDGIADILWRKGSTNALWYMKSNGKHTYKNIGSKSTVYTPY